MRSAFFGAMAGYRVLPGIAGRANMVLALIARIPAAMIPLGVMAAFTQSTGSIATGGLATGYLSMATAVFSPLVGKWVDGSGQRMILSIVAPIHAGSLIALFFAAINGFDGPALFALCALTGATMIPIGSFTRARWSMITTDPRTLSTAFSYESTVDEMVFILGPAFVGIASAAAMSAAPLGLAAALVVLAVIPFALTSPRHARHERDAVVASAADRAGTCVSEIPRPGIFTTVKAIATSLIVMAAIGTFFGASQAAITERATFLGIPDAAGLVYALMGVGSAVMALCAVAIPASVTLATRVFIGGAGMTLFTFLTVLQGNLVLTGVMLLITGLFLGPTLVTGFTAAERLAPRGGMSIAMTTMQAAMTVGVSLGSAVGGVLAQSRGADAAYWFATAMPVIITAVGFVMTRKRRVN